MRRGMSGGFVALSFLLLAASPAMAQTWTGAGANDNWSTGANWSGGVPPASSPATQLTFPTSTPRRTPVVDTPWTVNQLNFQAGAYSISGQTLTFDGAAANITSTGGNPNRLSNPIVLAVPTFIGGSANFVTLSGPISGPGSLTIGGNGPTLIASTSTFTGGVTVQFGGILGLAGSMPGPVTVTTAGIFSGSGTVAGPVTLTGANSSLNMTAPLATGALTVGAGSFVNISINGSGPGQFGTVGVTGTVDITGATLNPTGSYVPVPGDVFTLITNDGTDPVVGTFAGLPEGATVLFNGVRLRISYVGGTGNDVTLATFSEAPVPTLSEWGLILLASILAGIGMLRQRRG